MMKILMATAITLSFFIIILLSSCEKDANYYLHSGNMKFLSKQTDEAIKDYDKAIKMNPKLTQAYYERGRCYKEKQKYDLAKKDFETVVKLDPNSEYGKTSQRLITEMHEAGQSK